MNGLNPGHDSFVESEQFSSDRTWRAPPVVTFLLPNAIQNRASRFDGEIKLNVSLVRHIDVEFGASVVRHIDPSE